MSRIFAAPGQRWRRTASAVASGILLAGVGSGVAQAHVTVHVDNPTAGAGDVAVSFRVPNERDDAGTTTVDVYFPVATPLLDVLVQPHPGWTAKSTTQHLAKPVTTDDGTITEAVSEVSWKADTAADALAPGQSADFVVTAGQLPDTRSLTFKVLQTYAGGQVVRWIELPSTALPDPDNPAPTVVLTPAAAVHTGGGTDDTARLLGALGLVAGAAGVGAALLTRRRSRDGHLSAPLDRPAEHAR